MFYLISSIFTLAFSFYLTYKQLKFKKETIEYLLKVDTVNKDISLAVSTMIKAVDTLNNKVETYEKNNRKVQNNLLDIAKIQQEHLEDLLSNAPSYTSTTKKSYN